MKIINEISYSDDMTVLCHCPQHKTGTIVVPEGTLGIKQEAFKNCSIDSIILPNSLERIGYHAFADCKRLEGICLPERLEYLGKGAFRGCLRLAYVIIPSKLSEIQDNTFAECMMLKSVNLPDSGLKTIGNNCFKDCFSLEKIVIPASVTKMGTAFRGCLNFTRIIIKSTAIDINLRAFDGCSQALEIVKLYHINGDKRIFRENKLLTPLMNKPKGIKSRSLANLTLRGKMNIPNDFKFIGSYAFYNNTGLEGICIPGSIKTISKKSFKGCINLFSLEIKDGVEQIDEHAFENCSSLTSIVLPNTIRQIKSKAFSGCTSLTHVTLPEQAVVAEDAFDGASQGLQVSYTKVED
jgi:hypothetical protein